MRKYPLMGGCIAVVVLLVLGSLTNVVGYQSVQSAASSGSPLFTIKTKKAINQQQNILTLHYLGIGIDNNLQFPMRNKMNDSLQKVLETIRKIDDQTFAQFTELCIQKIRQSKTLSNIESAEISRILHQFRYNPEIIMNSFAKNNNYNTTSSDLYSICHWLPGCIPYDIILFVINLITAICDLLTSIISCSHTCGIPCSASNNFYINPK